MLDPATGQSPGKREIHVYDRFDMVLERRFNGATEPAASLPVHWHEHHQVILAETRWIEYRYRNKSHLSPLGSLTVIPAGEPHSSSVLQDLAPRQALQNVNITPSILLLENSELPSLLNPVLKQESLFRRWQQLCASLAETSLSRLAAESIQQYAVGELQALCRRRNPPSMRQQGRSQLNRAREYLTSHFQQSISLQSLADLAALSRFHFLREFQRSFGMPPHAYQRQLRVERAKSLLVAGATCSHAAAGSGFYDQAHLTRAFRRVVGVTPGRYLRRSNPVQDRFRIPA